MDKNIFERIKASAPKPNFTELGKGISVKITGDINNDVVIFNPPIFRRLAITVEGRHRQKLLEGITHTFDGKEINDEGRVSE